MSPNKKRRHHFVPRFLLSRFSPDGINVGTVLLKQKKFIRYASIKEQCSASYLYGKTSQLEDGFAILEGRTSELFNKLRQDNPQSLSDQEKFLIYQFIMYQYQRTLGAQVVTEALAESFIRRMILESGRVNESDLAEVNFEFNSTAIRNVFAASKMLPVMFDMKVKLLLNEQKDDFVLSDNPVALYNQYASHDKKLKFIENNVGLAVKGLQIFLPIDTKFTLALFDPNTYEYGSSEKFTVRVSKNDAALLNMLQTANAMSCVYLKAISLPEEKLEVIAETHKDAILQRQPYTSSNPVYDSAGHQRKSISVTQKTYRLPRKFSFCNSAKSDSGLHYISGHELPIRSPELLKISQGYGDFLEEKLEERRKSRGNAEQPHSMRTTDEDPDT